MFPSVGLITIARRLKAPTFRCTFKSSPISSFHSSASSNDEWANFGTWDDRIQEPILLKQSIKHGVPIPHVSLEHAGLASIVGRRKVNEDRILLKELEADILCFGIFDGHAGALAAEFTKEHLVECIHSHLSKEHDLQKVLEAAFLDVNKKLSEHISGLAQKQSEYSTSCRIGVSNSIVFEVGVPLFFLEKHVSIDDIIQIPYILYINLLIKMANIYFKY